MRTKQINNKYDRNCKGQSNTCQPITLYVVNVCKLSENAHAWQEDIPKQA